MNTTLPTFEQVYNTLPANGWLSEAEARLLWDSVNLTTGSILEVGCYYGRSTVLLASTGRWVNCVDPFDGFDSTVPGDEVQQHWTRNMQERGIRNTLLYRMKIEVWAPKPMGFCYLDGDHTKQGTVSQIVKALRCNPTIIAIHDIADSGEGAIVRDTALGLLGMWLAKVERLAIWHMRPMVHNPFIRGGDSGT